MDDNEHEILLKRLICVTERLHTDLMDVKEQMRKIEEKIGVVGNNEYLVRVGDPNSDKYNITYDGKDVHDVQGIIRRPIK